MKKTLNALLLTCILASSMVTASPDFIEQAIQDGKLDVIKTCIETKFVVSQANKQKYTELANQMIDAKKEEKIKLSPYLTHDSISLGLALASIFALTCEGVETYSGAGWSGWKSYAAIALAAIKIADSSNKFIKDSRKFNEDAVKDGVANAQKVAQAVSQLPVR